MNMDEFEFGLDSFGEVSQDDSGQLLSDAETVRLSRISADRPEPLRQARDGHHHVGCFGQ